MNNPIKTQAQQGMATLIVVIVVLIITTLMVFFATKVGIFDQRMAGNEARYKEAFAAAEAGLDMAVQRFENQFTTNFSGAASWATIITNSAITAGTKSDGTTAETGEPSFGVTLTNVGTLVGGVNVYRISSTGRSADGTGTATVSREVTMKSILGGSAPDVPIIVNGSVGTGGDFNIVANPNGAGNGVPVSIWTGGPSPAGNVSMTGSSATCNIQYFDGNNPQCSNPSGNTELISDGDGSTLTAQNSAFPDVLPNDPNFPDDLFQFLFGVVRADWQTVYDMANSKHQVVADCSGLSATSGQKFRLWWITGDCNMGSTQVIGSSADPVILVIDDHQLDMGGGGARVNGLVFLFDNPSNVATPSADFHGSPAIYGSLISDVGGAAMNGSYSVVYDPTIMSSLTTGGAVDDGANYSIAYIPGSWRDF
jgi:Tfp pilus assembly protein PilX